MKKKISGVIFVIVLDVLHLNVFKLKPNLLRFHQC